MNNADGAQGGSISIRRYRPGDDILSVYRDSWSALKRSRGGLHPDEVVERKIRRSGASLERWLLHDAEALVAESGGKVVGFCVLSGNRMNRLTRSSYCRCLYVMRGYQRNRLRVGTELFRSMERAARAAGFSKIFTYSTPESVPFYEKMGVIFFPRFKERTPDSPVALSYGELSLGSRTLFPIEPFISELSLSHRLYLRVLRAFGKSPPDR
jgi:N-acetylglutamate synthase-like GNAT family acetyltransferase